MMRTPPYSKTQYPDVNHGYVVDYPRVGMRTSIRDAVKVWTFRIVSQCVQFPTRWILFCSQCKFQR